jgi:hypothetical protein
MSKAIIPKEYMALLKEASGMFSETGCVPGIDGEEVPAETIGLDAKEYISETIDDPEAIYDPEIWDTSGFALVPFRGWHKNGIKDAASSHLSAVRTLSNIRPKNNKRRVSRWPRLS